MTKNIIFFLFIPIFGLFVRPTFVFAGKFNQDCHNYCLVNGFESATSGNCVHDSRGCPGGVVDNGHGCGGFYGDCCCVCPQCSYSVWEDASCGSGQAGDCRSFEMCRTRAVTGDCPEVCIGDTSQCVPDLNCFEQPASTDCSEDLVICHDEFKINNGIIQDVIDKYAQNGDTILIKDGTYFIGEGGASEYVGVRVINKHLAIVGEGSYNKNDTENTVIKGKRWTIQIGDRRTDFNPIVVLKNLKIINTRNDGDAVSIGEGKMVLVNNWITGGQTGVNIGRNSEGSALVKGNIITDSGRGVAFEDHAEGEHLFFENNLIYNNGLAFDCNKEDPNRIDDIQIVNNTIISNGTITDFRESGNDWNLTWKNNIFVGEFRDRGAFGNFSYNNFWDGAMEPGEGNIRQAPQFVNYAINDFHLKDSSPSIDSGDPDLLDPDGTRSDIGAYGGPGGCILDSSLPGCGGSGPTSTPTASPTPTTATTIKEVLESYGTAGISIDLNSDKLINGIDFGEMLGLIQ